NTDIYRNAGNVGVGTATPQRKFHVSGNSGIMALEGTNHAYVEFYPDGYAAGRKAYFGFADAAINDMYFNNEFGTGVELTLGANGNVGINTTTGPASHKFEVNGNAKIGTSLDVGGEGRFSGEVISTNSDAFRMVSGNYGTFWRNDGSNTYL